MRQCSHCTNLLPRSFGLAENHTIAIIGDSGSGKSHYIAACIDQLKKGHVWQVIGCTRIAGQGETDNNYWTKYYNPVYLDREQLDANQRATSTIREPLIYELVFSRKSFLKPAKMVNLLFYDSAGMDIIDPSTMVHFNHYILNASAIIFLVDPQIVPGIAKKLPSHLKPPSGSELLHRTAEVLNRILQTFEQGLGKNPGSTIQTPIAITVSKSDLLKFVTKNNQTPYFLSEPAFGNKIETRAFETINREVQDLLKDADERELLTSVGSFANKNFFAVSATGWSPDTVGKFPTIEPLRCLDPLLWALWKLGLVDD